MTKRELRQTIADGEWWRKFGALMGWRLSGWTYRSYATFFREKGWPQEVSAQLREEIEAAIARARKGEL